MRLNLPFTLVLISALWACSETRRPAPSGNNNNNNNNTSCGNGRLDPGESCDFRIPTSSVGACPAACDDKIPCTRDMLVGSANACNAQCSFLPLNTCTNDDRCCPAGCTGASDNDCSVTCGNNQIERNETCDGNCPASCDDSNRCTADTAYGTSETCSLTCGYQIEARCMNGDGCCPAGCTSAIDGDCSTTCGNGSVDSNETCDGDCPASCDDSDACTVDSRTGSPENCNVSCVRQRISVCIAGDGCCPTGCTNALDSDCPASCELVTQCSGGDTCCPSGCNNGNDSDCPPGGNGAIGDACTSPSDCTSSPDATPVCNTGAQWPNGYCTLFCTSAMCPSGSRCDLETFQCLTECTPGSPIECRFQDGYGCEQRFDPLEQTFFGCLKPAQ
jgi:hypothetical protein